VFRTDGKKFYYLRKQKDANVKTPIKKEIENVWKEKCGEKSQAC